MTALLADAEPTSRSDFLAFLDSRPDHERWELIDGQAVMQASPSVVHQIIAGNLAALINSALESRASTWMALQNSMVDLTALVPRNMYVPDILVMDTQDVSPNQNTTSECIAAVEILSPSDSRRVGPARGRKIDLKLERYRLIPSCLMVMIIRQDAPDMRLFERSGETWTERRFTDPGEEVSIASLGLTCRLRDIYRRTPLARSGS